MQAGGPITDFRIVRSEAEFLETLDQVWGSGEEWMILGGGSNLVVGSEGFDGTVISVQTSGVEILREEQDLVIVRATAGTVWDELVAFTVAGGLSGIEALSGIPGRVGAAPMQNIGAYGTELSDVLLAIDFVDYLSGERLRLAAADLELGYRTSTLKQGRQGAVLSIDIALRRSELSAPIAYQQLADTLGVALGERASLTMVRDAVLQLRASKGMVLDADDPDSVSAGSFFTNPIVSADFALTLPADAPRWPVGMISDAEDLVVPLESAAVLDDIAPLPTERQEAYVKLSAAWLIQHAGLRPGFALPGSQAQLSSKHTLAITNRGGASGEDVAELARYIQGRVLSEFGVLLQPEPVLLGLTL